MSSTKGKRCRKVRSRAITWNTLPERIKKVREKLLSAGNTIGGVTFEKRTDGSQRTMSYRLHAKHPSYTAAPDKDINRRKVDAENLQITVLDVNKIIRDGYGEYAGKGEYRTIPLENVQRIRVKGTEYRVEKNKRKNSNK